MVLSDAEANGRLIAAARVLAGIDQATLADASGVSASTISNVERGRNDARRSTIQNIRRTLGERYGISLSIDNVNHRIAVATYFEPRDE